LPAKIERKVLKTGDSKVMAIPPDWARMFNIKVGDKIVCLYDTILIYKPPGMKLDSDFLKQEFAMILELEEKEGPEKESKA